MNYSKSVWNSVSRAWAVLALMIIATTTPCSVLGQEKPLNVTVTMMPSSGAQREIFYDVLSEFERQHRDVDVHIRVHPPEFYKENIVSMLEQSPKTGDVFFWFGGQALTSLVEKDLLWDLTDHWQQRNWSNRFIPLAQSVVEQNQRIHAVPLNYYQWGIYYRRSLFEQYNLSAPTHWSQLLTACQTLAQHHIAMFTLGEQSPWTVAAWFDYLSLRINGLETHRQLTSGQASFTTAQVKRIFDHWQQAIDAGCFVDAQEPMNWREALPLLFYNKAAAVLMGNFFVVSLPETVRDDLVFSPFPMINPDLPRYEEAPMDVIMVANSSGNNPAVKRLLNYLAESDALSVMNQALYKLNPVHTDEPYQDRFMKAGDALLKEAEGVVQFYDRDTKPEMARPAMELMVMFHKQELTADEVMHTLEMYRKTLYKE